MSHCCTSSRSVLARRCRRLPARLDGVDHAVGHALGHAPTVEPAAVPARLVTAEDAGAAAGSPQRA